MIIKRLPRHLAAGLAAIALALVGLPSFFPSAAAVAASPRAAHLEMGRIPRPRRDSIEYRLSWGLASINADRAYARGYNGNGVTVALIDTGLAGTPANLFGRVSDASIDLIPSRRQETGKANHGAQTATLLAAASDGKGMVGVAYGATLLSIRADIDGSCERQCAVRGTDLARGIDYALAHGARIIGVPLVGPRPLPSVEPALKRAIAAGAVIVAAAGNDGSDRPGWPARYASDPRFANSILVAGASTLEGVPARWSSKAAGAEGRYLVAPGEKVIVGCSERHCSVASGTSYAVPYVAGALSLLMAAHPDLGAPQAAEILLRTAADRGVAGADSESGRGLVDVARALRLADQQSAERERSGL